MKPDGARTVREIAIQNPHSVRVFESLGIDYCCGGKQPLREACDRANVPLDKVLNLLSTAAAQQPDALKNWSGAGMVELTQHIVEQHHGYIRRESPRLASMLEKVVTRHGEAHPELRSIQDLFGAMVNELSVHMMKEENVLFPYLAKMEAAVKEGVPAPSAMFGSVQMPIRAMMADHEDAGELTARIRTLCGDYQPQEYACGTHRALYQGLEEFERDLHQHVHLENNILFPRALEMEQKEAAGIRS